MTTSGDGRASRPGFRGTSAPHFNDVGEPDRQGAFLPESDPSWKHYANTVLEVGGTEGVRIDLRSPVSLTERRRLVALGLTGPFAVVTPANPLGLLASPEDNARRMLDLYEHVRRSAWVHVAAAGCSPDSHHREDGLALLIPKETARVVAKSYGQSAFFWCDGRSFWIIGAMVQAKDQRLP